MPKTRTPRDLLLAALERRRLTGFRSSGDAAWVIFPPEQEGGANVEVIHLPRADRFRVISTETDGSTRTSTRTIGDFVDCDAAAACVEEALSVTGDTSDAGGTATLAGAVATTTGAARVSAGVSGVSGVPGLSAG